MPNKNFKKTLIWLLLVLIITSTNMQALLAANLNDLESKTPVSNNIINQDKVNTGTVVSGHMYIPKGTEIECELITPLDSSKNKMGDKVSFRIVNPLIVNNIKIILAGSIGEALVSQVSNTGAFGAAGSLTIKEKQKALRQLMM